MAGSETDYGSALDAALGWQRDGAEWIHLVDLDAAFGRGSNRELLAEVIASWAPDDAEPAATAAAHHAWVSRVAAALAPGALPGGYPNILGPDDTGRTRLGFGANADRLLAAKRRYDPDGVLSAVAAIGG